MRLRKTVVAVSIFCLTGFGGAVPAGTDSDRVSTKTAAYVRFVIHIPQTLSMRVGSSGTVNRQADSALNPPLNLSRTAQTIEVRISGRLSPGGSVALTAADAAASDQARAETLHRATIIWKAGADHVAGDGPKQAEGAGAFDRSTAHAFSYSERHRLTPENINRQVLYIVSAP